MLSDTDKYCDEFLSRIHSYYDPRLMEQVTKMYASGQVFTLRENEFVKVSEIDTEPEPPRVSNLGFFGSVL